jgi:hypothetical protein
VEVVLGESAIEFRAYRFAPASVYPAGWVSCAQIRDVDPASAPPEIRLHSGETLFVPGSMGTELREFCARNAVEIVARPDLWDALLAPFIDTEFTDEVAADTHALLARYGVTPADIVAIRARFAPAMIAYNFGTGLWDWVHLGLMDLLEALSGPYAGEHRVPDDEFASTYWWAMALADRAAR